MFVRHQSLRRSSLMLKVNIFSKLELYENDQDDVSDDEGPLKDSERDAVDPNEVVTITLGKTVFKTLASSLLNLPKTRLAKLYLKHHRRNRESSLSVNMHFDRDPKIFYHIIDAYERKSVHVPRQICIRWFKQEMEYWKMTHSLVAPCCRDCYMEAFEDIYQQDMLEERVSKISISVSPTVRGNIYASIKENIWEFLENYSSSKQATWFSWLYNTMIIISVGVTFFTTNLSYRVLLPEYTEASKNHTRLTSGLLSSTTLTEMLLRSQPHWTIILIEMTCAIFFTTLLILKLLSSPNKTGFFLSLRFLCETLYVISAWLLYGTSYFDASFWTKPGRASYFQAVQVVSIFRFIRLYMLEKSYQPFRILKLAAQSTVKEITMLFMFITLAVILYGSFIYCSELLATKTFGDTFTGMWCVLITMLTVGYGDAIPTSVLGQIIASFCALTGIIMVGMPLPLIANSFHGYYEYVYFSVHKQYTAQKGSAGKLCPLS